MFIAATISSDALESLLNMIYTSQLDVTESNIIEIQLAANYLDLKQVICTLSIHYHSSP